MKKLLILFISLIFFSCSDEEVNYDAKNEKEINAYLTANNLTAQKTSSGLYYIINNEGTGVRPTNNSNVTLGYKGYFLDGKTFDESTSATFDLNRVVPGFSQGVQLLKEGGSGTFILPSRLGYGNRGTRGISGGSVIVFNINLIRVN